MGELIQRCSWATTDLYKEYHDNEWGKPVHDENKLFEMLILGTGILIESNTKNRVKDIHFVGCMTSSQQTEKWIW